MESVKQMIQLINEFNKKGNKKITISIEIEKSSKDVEELLPLTDYVFISKDYAISKGLTSMENAVNHYSSKIKER